MRAALLLAGLAVTGYGAYGWLTHDGAQPLGQLVFLAVLLVTHDFVVVPAVILTGVILARWVPEPARVPARAALVVSAAVTVVALPFIVGAGRIADNPSAFPQSYGRGLALVLAAVWAAAAGWTAGWTAVRARRRR